MVVPVAAIQIIVNNSRIPLWSVYIKNDTKYTFVNTKRTWVTFITWQNLKTYYNVEIVKNSSHSASENSIPYFSLLLRIDRRLYIQDFDFSETLNRQSLKVWSHINSTVCHSFTGKLKRLRKDNYYSGVTALSIAYLKLNLVQLKFNNGISLCWVVLHIRVLFVCPQRRSNIHL